jgi:hypothetical protein
MNKVLLRNSGIILFYINLHVYRLNADAYICTNTYYITWFLVPFKAEWYLYVPAPLAISKSAFCVNVFFYSQYKQRLFL